MDMVEMVFAKSDPSVHGFYERGLVDKSLWDFGHELREKYEDTKNALLRVSEACCAQTAVHQDLCTIVRVHSHVCVRACMHTRLCASVRDHNRQELRQPACVLMCVHASMHARVCARVRDRSRSELRQLACRW